MAVSCVVMSVSPSPSGSAVRDSPKTPSEAKYGSDSRGSTVPCGKPSKRSKRSIAGVVAGSLPIGDQSPLVGVPRPTLSLVDWEGECEVPLKQSMVVKNFDIRFFDNTNRKAIGAIIATRSSLRGGTEHDRTEAGNERKVARASSGRTAF